MSTRYAWLGTLALAALVASGCGGDAATPNPADSPATAGGGEPAQPVAPPAPAAAPDPANPMSWARCSAAYGYLVIPSVNRLLERSKAIAKVAMPDAPADEIDNVEQQVLGEMGVPAKAFETIDRDRALVLVMTDPDEEQKDPPFVAVIPVSDTAAFRAALATPPAMEGVPEEELAKMALKESAGEDGIFLYGRVEKRFDYEAYDKALAEAREADKPEPDFDAFNVEQEVTKLWCAERDKLILLAPNARALKTLLAADLPTTAPALPPDDALVWIDGARLRERFAAELDEGLGEMRKEIGRETRGAPDIAAKTADDIGSGFEAIVRQARDGEIRVSLDPAIKLSFSASFPADQSVGAALAAQLNDGPDLVGYLPADAQIVATSRLHYTEGMRTYFGDMFQAFVEEAQKGADRAEAKAMLDKWKGILERSYSAMSGETAAAMGLHREHGLWEVAVSRVLDEVKARASARESIAGIQDMLAMFMKELPAGEVVFEVEHQPEAASHRDVVLDRFALRIAVADDVPAAGLIRQVMKRLFGGSSVPVWYGVAKGHMVVALGADAEVRCKATLDLLLDGTTAGPGGDWPAVAKAIGAQPTFAFYMAPLSMMDEGFNMATVVQAAGCLEHQAAIAKAAAAYHTQNGAWPRDIRTLYGQELLSPAGDVGCGPRYQIDPNTGAVRCALHGTVEDPHADLDPGEALGFPWQHPEGSGGFAYFGTVRKVDDAVAIEVGVAMPVRAVGDLSKAIQPLAGAMADGGRRHGGPPPMPMGDGLSGPERQVVMNLRQIAVFEGQFQAAGAVDQDADGLGEFGFFGELAGTEAVRGHEEPLEVPLLAPIMGRKNDQGVVTVGAYCYRIYLPSGPNDDPMADSPRALGEPAAGCATLADKKHADPQEARWACYAWPVERGPGATRVFFINESGDVYSTTGDVVPYAGVDAPPPAHAAYDAEGMDPGNLDAGVGLAAAGLRAVDGNTWVPAGN